VQLEHICFRSFFLVHTFTLSVPSRDPQDEPNGGDDVIPSSMAGYSLQGCDAAPCFGPGHGRPYVPSALLRLILCSTLSTLERVVVTRRSGGAGNFHVRSSTPPQDIVRIQAPNPPQTLFGSSCYAKIAAVRPASTCSDYDQVEFLLVGRPFTPPSLHAHCAPSVRGVGWSHILR
jgi:hypothetical protein